MKESQRKYLEEYEKYKHIKIEPGSYFVKDRIYLIYDIISVDEEEQIAVLLRNNSTMTKTIHWCRKKLERKETWKNFSIDHYLPQIKV